MSGPAPIRFHPALSGDARNKPCACGSGRKAKRCCGLLDTFDRAARAVKARALGKVCVYRSKD